MSSCVKRQAPSGKRSFSPTNLSIVYPIPRTTISLLFSRSMKLAMKACQWSQRFREDNKHIQRKILFMPSGNARSGKISASASFVIPVWKNRRAENRPCFSNLSMNFHVLLFTHYFQDVDLKIPEYPGTSIINPFALDKVAINGIHGHKLRRKRTKLHNVTLLHFLSRIIRHCFAVFIPSQKY